MTLVDGVFTGVVIGLVFSLPAMLAALMHKETNLPIVLDVRRIWGVSMPHKDVLFLSVLFHVLVSVLFCGLYAGLVQFGVLDSFAFLHITLYATIFYFCIGLIVAPALGLGIFGKNEGRFVWLELLISHVLYLASYWYVATHLLLP